MSMMTVGSLVSRAVSDPSGLARELDGWVLVGPRPQNEENEWSFRTLSARTVRDAAGEIEAVLDENYVVFVLKKNQRDAWAKTILVGRSRTNDVCVTHSSISKLHARVRIGDDGLFLSDAGSSNGTSVNGNQLPAGQEKKLDHKMQVRFGGCSFQVFEPQRFAEILQRFSRSSPVR
jgi:pSer/pThr/pTyr-binding forkhead associated (FHA) protein